MPVQRPLPTDEATELLALTRQLAREELAPRVATYESEGRFPREVFATLGKAGLLGLPYDEQYGGGGQPYEVYLQVVEELATVWARRGSACTHWPASRWRRSGARSSVSVGCPTWSAATCWGPTASPSRSPAPTRRP